jgi:hypothetical protein
MLVALRAELSAFHRAIGLGSSSLFTYLQGDDNGKKSSGNQASWREDPSESSNYTGKAREE